MTHLKLSLLAGLTAITVALGGCSAGAGDQSQAGSGAANPDEVVVTVEGEKVTRAEYDKYYDELAKGYNISEMPNPDQKKLLQETLKQLTLNKLILTTLIHQDAAKAGIQVSDEDVATFKQDNIFSNEGGREQLEMLLTQLEMSEAEFDASLKEQLLMEKFINKTLGDKIKVQDADISAFYKNNQEKFIMPDRIHAHHILVRAIEPQIKKKLREENPDISEEALAEKVEVVKAEKRKTAEKLFQEVNANPESFAELAKEHSEDPGSAPNGGDLDYMVEQNTDATFWMALEKTRPGRLHAGVVETPFGFHIIKVEDKQPASQVSLAEAKEQIRTYLKQTKLQQEMQAWAQKRQEEAAIKITPKYQPETLPQQALQMEPAVPGKQTGQATAKDNG